MTIKEYYGHQRHYTNDRLDMTVAKIIHNSIVGKGGKGQRDDRTDVMSKKIPTGKLHHWEKSETNVIHGLNGTHRTPDYNTKVNSHKMSDNDRRHANVARGLSDVVGFKQQQSAAHSSNVSPSPKAANSNLKTPKPANSNIKAANSNSRTGSIYKPKTAKPKMPVAGNSNSSQATPKTIANPPSKNLSTPRAAPKPSTTISKNAATANRNAAIHKAVARALAAPSAVKKSASVPKPKAVTPKVAKAPVNKPSANLTTVNKAPANKPSANLNSGSNIVWLKKNSSSAADTSAAPKASTPKKAAVKKPAANPNSGSNIAWLKK